jgi:N-acetylgalactosamine-N,N'-diacetylbacillosaminyl-diphospho-undecaprenol 4-alpha-N-acetylgalactosaminyltransferase
MENAILIIIGVGEDEQKIKSLISVFGLYNNVFLLGHTYNPFYILSKADCYLLSSRFEGFPNSLLEAISLGVPSIAVDCKSGPREIYEFPLQKELTEEFVVTASGILVQNFNQNAFSNAIQLLYRDTELRHTISENSRKRILNFSIDKSMLEHTDLLEKIVND